MATNTTRLTSLFSTFPVGNNSYTAGNEGKPTTELAVNREERAGSRIYNRNINKSKGAEVSLGSYAFLLSQIVQYTQKKVDGIGEFEGRLNILGYNVGTRLVELTACRENLGAKMSSRITRLIPILSYVHTTLYKQLFGHAANSLEKSTDNEDEYMIADDDMLVTRSVHVPKEMSDLSCGALVAGMIEGFLDTSGFPCKVTSHAVPSDAHPRRTVLLIKLEAAVLRREAAFSGASA